MLNTPLHHTISSLLLYFSPGHPQLSHVLLQWSLPHVLLVCCEFHPKDCSVILLLDFLSVWLIQFHFSRHSIFYLSTVQGSGMGPVAYLLNASDLRPIDQDNMIFKYADDTYLIVPDSNIQTILMEMQHISEWAMCHNLKLNQYLYTYLYWVTVYHFNVFVENFTSHVTLYLYVCWCHGLQLPDCHGWLLMSTWLGTCAVTVADQWGKRVDCRQMNLT